MIADGIGYLNRSDASSLASSSSLCDSILSHSTLELERAVADACADVSAWLAKKSSDPEDTLELQVDDCNETEVPFAVARAIAKRFNGKARAAVEKATHAPGDGKVKNGPSPTLKLKQINLSYCF